MDWRTFFEDQKKQIKISEAIGTKIMGFEPPVHRMLFVDLDQNPHKIIYFNPMEVKSDALRVVEKMNENRFIAKLEIWPDDHECTFENLERTDEFYAGAKTMQMAICLAALKAFDIKIEGVTE